MMRIILAMLVAGVATGSSAKSKCSDMIVRPFAAPVVMKSSGNNSHGFLPNLNLLFFDRGSMAPSYKPIFKPASAVRLLIPKCTFKASKG